MEAAARAFWLANNVDDEAWALAAWDGMGGPEPTEVRAGTENAMRAAIDAAEPHIRAKVAAEIIEAANAWQSTDGDTPFFAPAVTDWACELAARITRQEQP